MGDEGAGRVKGPTSITSARGELGGSSGGEWLLVLACIHQSSLSLERSREDSIDERLTGARNWESGAETCAERRNGSVQSGGASLVDRSNT